MSDPRLRLHAPKPAPPEPRPRRPIGRYLRERELVSARDLITALSLQSRQDAQLGDILVAEGMVREADVLEAVATQHGLHVVDLDQDPPDAVLIRLMPAEFWLRHQAVPWMMLGRTLVIATPRPDLLDDLKDQLPLPDRRILAVVASARQIEAVIARAQAGYLARRAEHRVPAYYSCRSLRGWLRRRTQATAAASVLGGVVALGLWQPDLVTLTLFALATVSLLPVAGLKIVAFVIQLLARQHETDPRRCTGEDRLPRVSILVPLYREPEIAGALLERLNRLTYPRALLDVILVLEESDRGTRDALGAAGLPGWIRLCPVPGAGSLRTKPRALNYALDFARGDIVGVWDAEDAPAADQIEETVARFAEAPDDVVCLQGVLDYYNPRATWLTRCFTIEYAGWWRILLPGIARLGLILPLGGTTLFFRRQALEELGAWDAHNVTEDADLGVRLARLGYRTELIPTVTHEEATSRIWPWVRQRSRWLKGFAMTWWVHMRHPRALLRDVGWWRFAGLQVLLAGTVLQFALAPVLWSFWLLVLVGGHPVSAAGPRVVALLSTLFIVSELANLAIGAAGVARPGRRFLMPWVFTLPVYYMLGAVAAAKAGWELVWQPYFWDKTAHGRLRPDVGKMGWKFRRLKTGASELRARLRGLARCSGLRGRDKT